MGTLKGRAHGELLIIFCNSLSLQSEAGLAAQKSAA